MSGRYLDPLVLAGISSLELRARRVVEGFVSGLHSSPTRGHSLEFAQHREYAVGDELRHIDWKVYGRTDRFFVKQFQEETNLRLHLLVDASGSMRFKGAGSALSKYDYAAVLAASLSYLALRQGDSAGLSAFHGASGRSVPPHNSLSHLPVLLSALEEDRPEGETRLSDALSEFSASCGKRSLVVLLSDLFDAPEEVLRMLKFLAFKKHEVLVLHLLDPEEAKFPYSGHLRFESLEDGSAIEADAGALAMDYRRALEGLITEYRLSLRAAGIGFHSHWTNEPPDRVLRSVLGR